MAFPSAYAPKERTGTPSEPDQQEPFRKELAARGLKSVAPTRGDAIELE